MEKIFWLQVKTQCSDNVDIRLNITKGMTRNQTDEFEKRLSELTDTYGKAHDEDYAEFDDNEAVETVLEDMGIEYKYPPVEYTVYI